MREPHVIFNSRRRGHCRAAAESEAAAFLRREHGGKRRETDRAVGAGIKLPRTRIAGVKALRIHGVGDDAGSR